MIPLPPKSTRFPYTTLFRSDQIRAVVNNTLNELNLTDGLIIIDDKGALDCAIKARVQCAVLRGAEETELDWSKLL